MQDALNVEVRIRTDSTMPFWHADEPTVAAMRVDPEFADLRRVFPESWRHLVEAMSLLDCHSMVGRARRPHSDLEGMGQDVALAVASALWRAAEAERTTGRRGLAETVSDAAERFAMHAATGEWKPFVVAPPVSDQPWFYCGPLGTWAPRSIENPLGLLVVAPEPSRQAPVTRTDLAFDRVQGAVAEALAGEVALAGPRPEMHVGQLLLAGGESAFGHKNFAHFFPLEAAGGSVTGADFTVVFGNIHEERIRRCSLPLLRDAHATMDARPPSGVSAREAADASLIWFRCHDLGHFWRRLGTDGTDAGARRVREKLGDFMSMALEETYADSIGLVAAAALTDHRSLGVAYSAELFRYLSRRQSDFADSVAAALELGWFATHGTPLPAAPEQWVAAAVPVAADLVRTIHSVLWEGDQGRLSALTDALDAGRDQAGRFQPLFAERATDLSYVFA